MRIHGQKKRFGLAVALVASGTIGLTAATHRASAAAAVSDDGNGMSLEADVSERKLILRDNGEVVHTFTVAVGKGSKPTPRGNYKVRKIVWNPAWVPPDEPWARSKTAQPPGAKANPMKLVKIFFKEPDYYMHGTNDLESLGDAASHGCLRMDPDDAYRLARYLMEHGGAPRDESWFWRVLHFRSESKTVYLDNPVPMVVAD